MSATLAMLVLAAAGAPVFESCQIGDPAAGPRMAAECASVMVAENPARPHGRQISLRIARLKARTGEPAPNPLVFIAGGPGQSALQTFPGVAPAFAEIRRQRDILLIDQRGTGGSNPLKCPALADPAGEALEVDLDKARQAAAECVASLDADTRYYTTLDAVRDLESVRKALGEEAFALYGISYGTRVALEYLRRHPERVEAVILDGVTVPGEALGPEIAADAQRALELMFERCADSETCAVRFPDLRRNFAELRARLEGAPVTVNIRDPFTGESVDTTLSWPRAAMLLRMYSYAPESMALLPLLLELAAAGDWQAFAANVLAMERQAEDLLNIGMHNSVVCSEDAPSFPAASEPASAPDPRKGPYLGTLTTDLIRAMCSAWPVRELPDDFHSPVTSDKPVLLLSGEADPVTPPENAAEVARHLPNSRHLVAPGQGHGVAWRGCAPRLMAEFLRDGKPADLDAECLDELAAAPFFIDRNGPTP